MEGFRSPILFLKRLWNGKSAVLLFGLYLGLFSHNLCAEENPSIRHLYLTWQHDPSSSITVNIHGIKTPEELTIYYDHKSRAGNALLYSYIQSGKAWREIVLPDGRLLYHIELSDLIPGTQYYFTIGDRGRSFTSEMSFKTIPNGQESLLFIEGGDWENTAEAEILAKQAAKWSPYAVFLGGDYPSGVLSKRDYRKWDKWLDVYQQNMVTPEGCLIPLVMAIGNHEVVGGFNQSKAEAPFFFHYFKQGDTGESYFSLPFGERIQLFVLDSGHAAEQGDVQEKWLRKEMEVFKEKPIKMAIYHVPLFPSIRFTHRTPLYHSIYGLIELFKGKNAASKLLSPNSQQGRRHWLPIFDANRLTVAFEHHDQTLKRTKLLKGGKPDAKGTLYLGDGGWGPKIIHSPIQGYFYPYFAKLIGKQHFFWIVSIEDSMIVYSAVNTSGNIIDQFIQKINIAY